MEKEVEYAWNNYTVSWLKPCGHHAIQDTMIMRKAFKSQEKIKCIISFDANFSPFSLAESPPRDLQITVLQIMVYSYAMSSNCVRLQIIFCSCDHSFVKMAACRIYLSKKKKNDLATEWWNNYWTRLSQNISRVLSVESRSIIYLGRNIRLRQIIDLLATDKRNISLNAVQ